MPSSTADAVPWTLTDTVLLNSHNWVFLFILHMRKLRLLQVKLYAYSPVASKK